MQIGQVAIVVPHTQSRIREKGRKCGACRDGGSVRKAVCQRVGAVRLLDRRPGIAGPGSGEYPLQPNSVEMRFSERENIPVEADRGVWNVREEVVLDRVT